jgi:hypothetical protein
VVELTRCRGRRYGRSHVGKTIQIRVRITEGGFQAARGIWRLEIVDLAGWRGDAGNAKVTTQALPKLQNRPLNAD